jgi:hypothetical protein
MPKDGTYGTPTVCTVLAFVLSTYGMVHVESGIVCATEGSGQPKDGAKSMDNILTKAQAINQDKSGRKSISRLEVLSK